MKAWPELALLAGALAVTPAAAQMGPATPDQLVDATRACIAATSPTGVDAAALEGAGWRPGSVSAGGESVSTPLRFFGKAGANVVMIVPPAEARPICASTARVAAADDRTDVAQALTAALGAPVAADANVTWRTDRHLVVLDATGTEAAPAVRVAVLNRPQEAR